ncbi:MAG: UDP-N-acetylmuramoyl-tripeptide--D-alanyl-D-alanine ligase [Clostridia bacterium]|nr:UDP-N-acetylmuramoyl-tripeptide--D-alanyl-D-alanine ligase [Clostridia bacterium]
MIFIVLLTLYLLGFAVCMTFAIRHYVHMFQLNSYKPHVQRKWYKTNAKDILLKTLPSLAIIPICVFLPKIGVTAASIYFIIIAYLNRRIKDKKPLVYTNRVKRLLVTINVLTLGACLCAAIPAYIAYNNFADKTSSKLLFSCLTVGYYILLPYIILLANLINKPIEKAINNKFIREAENMIKSMPQLKVVGITGSYGKTSVKYYLTTLLSAKYNVLMTPESYNTTLGVVRTIREKLRATHEIFVCEMGARNVGDIKEICDIVHPDCGIITSVGPQHLESFHTIDNIKKTKFELADSLPDDGIAFLNGNDENIASVGYKRKNITYGVEAGDYQAYDLSLSSKGTTFKIKTPTGETAEFTTKLIGKHNVQNVAGAIACAHTLGVSLPQLAGAVRRLQSVEHRLQLSKRGNINIIDDAYNSNPNGTKVALDTLSMFDGIKVIVTPGMVELGNKQDEYNYEFGKNCAAVCDYIILVGKKQTESIAKGVNDAGYDSNKLIICDTIEDAFKELYAIKTDGKELTALLENDLPDNFL